MCTKPHPTAVKAYQIFLETNLGDSGLFTGSLQLEREAVAQLSSLLHSDESMGFLVSGGTEANLMALLAARSRVKIPNQEVVLAESVHFSFTKICNVLRLKPVHAQLDSNFRIDAEDVGKKISKNTVAIVGTAGTAELGVVDPIDELSEVAAKKGVFLHVDAAFGGLVIPFLGNSNLSFDFSLGGVESITVDPHKMGMAPIPAGGIIFRRKQTVESLKTDTPYLTDKFQYTFSGTRSGASAAAVWAVLKSLGREGFAKVVGDCMKITKLFVEGIQEAGYQLVVKPQLNIIAFRCKNTRKIAEKLWSQGWFVSYVPHYDCIRIVVMPHVKREHAEAFLADLRKIERL